MTIRGERLTNKIDKFKLQQVTGSSDFTVKLWDMKTGSEKLRFLGHMSAVSGVAYKVYNFLL